MNIEVMSMTLTDLDKIEDYLLEDFDDFWSSSMLRQELENKQNLNSHYFVAKIDETIVGFIGLLIVLDEVTIMNMVTRKDKRNLRCCFLFIKIHYTFF